MFNSIKCFSTLLLAVFVLSVASAAKAVPPSRTSSPPPIGSNLDVVADWSTEIPFIDVFKLSRPWIPKSERYFDTGEANEIETDSAGWVIQLPQNDDSFTSVQTVLFTKSGVNYPKGEYTVLYEGTGTILYGGDAQKIDDLSSEGVDIVQVEPGSTNAGIVIEITETDPDGTGDYLRNIQMLLPGFSAEQAKNDIFNPDFLVSIDQYSVIRFMNWLRVNYKRDWQMAVETRSQPSIEHINPLDQLVYEPTLRLADWREPLLWANRAKVTDARYSTAKGVPIEIIAALANQIDSDIWLNIPHNVTEYYVWEYAKLMFEELEGDQQVYFEYSNEPWNTGFGQGEYFQEQAIQSEVSAVNGYEARLKWYAARSASLCNVWKQTWEEANDYRVTCVINAPITQPDKITTMLACDHWEHSPCYKHLDAVAVAPYFGQHIGQPEHLATLRQWANWGESGLDHLFEELRYGGKLPDVGGISPAPLPVVYENITTAVATVVSYVNSDNRRLKLVAYEGGQHLVGLGDVQNDEKLNTLFTEFNRNWRMKTLYADYLAMWNERGGDMFLHYKSTSSYSQWGYWGSQEYFAQPNAEKAEAIEVYVESFAEPDYAHHLFLPMLVVDTVAEDKAPFSVPMPDDEREAAAANAAHLSVIQEDN